MGEGKVIPLDEILKKTAPTTNYRNVTEILNTSVIITGADFEMRDIGQMAIIHTTSGDYYTFSKVLIDQLKQLNEYLHSHPEIGGVQAVIRKIKRYYTLDSAP